MSLFGVHASCVGNPLLKPAGDNKGYAAAHAEKMLQAAGAHDAVAVFAQATAGDVSPHYHGQGNIDAIFTYVDFTDIKADPEFANGQGNAEAGVLATA